MTKGSGKKAMSAREKKLRAEAMRQLKADGILPPDKKPLNRKRFCKEAEAILREQSSMVFDTYLRWGLLEMLDSGSCATKDRGRSPEAVGAAKAIKLAARRMAFEQDRAERGEPSAYKVGELYEAVKDILEA